MSYNLKYRTFNQLLEDVKVDFKNYALEGMIEPQQLIKVARHINKELGLKINMTKEVILDINKGRVKLPDDFYKLNFALICGEYSITQPVIQGTHISEVACTETDESVPNYVCAPEPVNLCTDPVIGSCKLSKCGDSYSLVQTIRTETRTYSYFHKLTIKKSHFVDEYCPNLNMLAANEGWIKDGWLYTSFQTGRLYLAFQGDLIDEEGNVLVPDHELLNNYYEYGLKDRILETLLFEGEDVTQKIQYIQAKLRAAKNEATSLVQTPDFAELQAIHDANRKAMYYKYYDGFKS